MIKSVYRICPACQGEGSVEATPNPRLDGTKSIHPSKDVPCEVCDSKGIVPTGTFILDSDNELYTFLEQINMNLNKTEKEAAMRLSLKP